MMTRPELLKTLRGMSDLVIEPRLDGYGAYLKIECPMLWEGVYRLRVPANPLTDCTGAYQEFLKTYSEGHERFGRVGNA